METRFQVADISKALADFAFPSVILWNRLEGRPRTHHFERALKAEVRDALWMLTRQWQMGEFKGDDAGSPVFAKVLMRSTKLTKYRPADHPARVFDETIPLEATVECRPISFTKGQQKMNLDLRLQMGRCWLKLLGAAGLGAYGVKYIQKYPIARPDPSDNADAEVCADPEVWASYSAVAGRSMDGGEIYFYLKGPGHHAYDGIVLADPGHQNILDDLSRKFIAWFARLYLQPFRPSSGESPQDAWIPDRLEYQFACSAQDQQGEKVLVADEYYHGHLDWYNFDLDTQSPGLEMTAAVPDMQKPILQTLIPTSISFEGMPNARWWAFEDRKTNFGDIEPGTTDLAKLLLIEFGLVYANDWFLVPYTLPLGSIARVDGLVVSNVFGERFWIEAAGSGADDSWQRWSMFTLNTKGKMNEVADTSLLLLPTVPKLQEGAPQEEVVLIRDEMANMVWGVEKRVALANGNSKPGSEAATELLNFLKKPLLEKIEASQSRRAELEAIPEDRRTSAEREELRQIKEELSRILPPEARAKIRYQVMNTVPEHWIPFIPVHIAGDNREIQLQRAAMPRILEGDTSIEKVRPRTSLLRQGLEQSPLEPYFVHEEEVPRAGVHLSQAFQRTRWTNGRVVVWLGTRKETGRGEGWSRLAFDQIVDVK